MLTSNVQLGYVLTRGGGQAVQGGLSWPLPRISERMADTQILLHHLLQENLVEMDINFITVNLRCLLQMFSWITYLQVVGGKLSRDSLPPTPRTRVTKLNIGCKHLSLAEIMFTSLTSKYSTIMVQ